MSEGNQQAESQPLLPPVADTAIVEPTNRQLALVLGSIWIGVVLTALDSTIVATLSAPISDSFSSLKTLSWLGTSFLVATAATQPISGRLTDIFGRRAGLLVCNILFGIGTLLCGIAQHEWVFILGRAVAGAGGGAMVAISTFVGSDLVPLRKRGVVQGINNIAMGAGAGLGGLLGGWLDHIIGWKSAFLVQLPFLVLGTILVSIFVQVPVKSTETHAWRRVDFVGSTTLTFGLVLLLLAVNTGGNILPWSHALVITTLVAGTILLGVFMWYELRIATEPVIPLRLMTDRTIASACATYLLTYMASFGIMYYIPIYLQLLGLSPMSTGLRFVPHSAGTALGALTTGITVRYTGKYVQLNILGHVLLVAASVMLLFLGWQTPQGYVMVALGIYGLGFGIMLVTTLLALISSAKSAQQAAITSASFAFRSVGSSLGLTVSSAVFQNALRDLLRRNLEHYHNVDELVERIRMSFDEISRLDPTLISPVKTAYMHAIQRVFVLTAVLSGLGALTACLQRQNVLHNTLSRE